MSCLLSTLTARRRSPSLLFNISEGTQRPAGSVLGYKWQPNDAAYLPCSPYPGRGRVGCGTFGSVYVANSGRGAMAEFFRRHPELLALQDDVDVVLHELDLETHVDALDLRTEPSQQSVGITIERLNSSDADEDARYAECRQLASEVIAEELVGILFPSAAANWPDAWNVVLFGLQSGATWECNGHRQVPTPRVSVAECHALP